MFYDNCFPQGRGFGRFTYWMGRHHHGRRGFRHFGSDFLGGEGRGGAGFRSGRKLGSQDLQLLILALLAESPSHGYELIKALEERSGGFYSPSPGVIYPALTYLEEIGHATVEAEGAKKLYRPTDAGREHLEKNRAAVDSMLAELERIAEKMTHIRRFFAGRRAEEEGDDERGSDLHSAWRELKGALHGKRRCSDEEAKRVAEILRRAAAEIAKG
jgi:DNA-binding PadR family transcriptional regulator